MCGRFVLTAPPETLARAFELRAPPQSNLQPRYNIAPSQPVWTVRPEAGGEGGGAREPAPMEWGLIPSWMDAPPRNRPMINARAETVASKPAFRAAYRRRRCLIPADGWYEWCSEAGQSGKQPYLIRPADAGERPFAFAGLWERWQSGDGSERETVAVVTMPAWRELAGIHERMPVVLARSAYGAWLDPEGPAPRDPVGAFDLLEGAVFESFPVSRRVNRPAEDDEGLIEPLSRSGRLL